MVVSQPKVKDNRTDDRMNKKIRRFLIRKITHRVESFFQI